MTRAQYEAQIQKLAKELEKAEAERDHWARQCEEMFRTAWWNGKPNRQAAQRMETQARLGPRRTGLE